MEIRLGSIQVAWYSIMKFLNEVPFLKAGIILLVMPASQTFAIEPNQVYLAQASAW